MNRLRVLWISHLLPYPPKGGVLQRSYNLIRELSRYHDVDLAAFVQHDLIRTHFSNLEHGVAECTRSLRSICSELRHESVPSDTHRLGKHLLALRSLRGDPYTIQWLRSSRMCEHLAQLRSKNEYDVVHYDTISLAPYRTLFPDVPSVLDHHNVESHMMLRRAENEDSILKRLYYRQEGLRLLAYERAHLREFNLHITCSRLDSERLREIDGDLQISEVENGVDLEYFQPAVSTKTVCAPPRLVFAGRLNAYSNRQAVLEIANRLWPALRSLHPQLSMEIVGPNPPGEILSLAQSDSRFHVHGYVDDVRPYLESADIYLCPISDGGGTKLKILDALAMGKAIVADPIACEGIEVVDGESVLFAQSAEEYRQRVASLVSNPELVVALGRNGRLLVERKYSYASIGFKLAGLFARLASNTGGDISACSAVPV